VAAQAEMKCGIILVAFTRDALYLPLEGLFASLQKHLCADHRGARFGVPVNSCFQPVVGIPLVDE
jgi:hypothetical protein